MALDDETNTEVKKLVLASISQKNLKIIIYLESPINWCDLLSSLWCQVSFTSSLSYIHPSSFHWSYYNNICYIALKSKTGNKKSSATVEHEKATLGH